MQLIKLIEMSLCLYGQVLGWERGEGNQSLPICQKNNRMSAGVFCPCMITSSTEPLTSPGENTRETPRDSPLSRGQQTNVWSLVGRSVQYRHRGSLINHSEGATFSPLTDFFWGEQLYLINGLEDGMDYGQILASH